MSEVYLLSIKYRIICSYLTRNAVPKTGNAPEISISESLSRMSIPKTSRLAYLKFVRYLKLVAHLISVAYLKLLAYLKLVTYLNSKTGSVPKSSCVPKTGSVP